MLHFRAFRRADCEQLADQFNRREVVRWMTGIPQPFTVAGCHAWQERLETSGVCTRAFVEGDERLVGGISLDPRTAEIGFWVCFERWGKGVGTSMVQRFLYEEIPRLPFRYVVAAAAPDNVGSARVLGRCGFERVLEAPYCFPHDPSATTAVLYRKPITKLAGA